MAQIPPFRPTNPPPGCVERNDQRHREGVTIRHHVQAEALSAAAKIREAVEQFTQATGLELHISVDYTTTRSVEDPIEVLHVTGVELDAGGVRVHG